MKSAWFWNSEQWLEYERYYYSGKPCPTYKSSPFADDYDFSDAGEEFDIKERKTRVINLSEPLALRKSYKNIVNRSRKVYRVAMGNDINILQRLHFEDAGRVTRCQETWDCMGQWLRDGCGVQFIAYDPSDKPIAGAYFIIWNGCAYYAVSASLANNVMHLIIVRAIEYLDVICRGRKLEMGDVSGTTEKEKSIGLFKQGFGGVDVPYLLATRRL